MKCNITTLFYSCFLPHGDPKSSDLNILHYFSACKSQKLKGRNNHIIKYMRKGSRMKRRLVVIVLCLCAVLSSLPEAALATDGIADREEQLYQLLLEGIRDKKGLDGESYIDLSELGLSGEKGSPDVDMLDTAFSRVIFDHPELYYVMESYIPVPENSADVLGIRPVYISAAQDAGAQARFDAAVDTALAQAEGLTDPVEQMLALYNYLIRTTAYNYDAHFYKAPVDLRKAEPKEAWTAYGALVTGDTVCKGYAMAWKVLMDRIGIPCLVICKGDRTHLWNLVQLDGKWYHIDVNSGNDIIPVLRGQCMYKDFLVTDAAMSKHGSWFVAGKCEPCPACTDERFSTGWLFREDNVFYPMYRDRSGQYYYIKYINVNTAKLYCGPLSGGGQEIAVLMPYTVFWDSSNLISSGVVWVEDCLYYVSAELELIRYRLSDGESVSLGRIQFTPQDTVDGRYKEDCDGISLLFDARSGVLSAQSRNRRTDLETWQIAPPQMEFEDVTAEDYFFQPVQWAVEKGIAKGTSKTAFSPALTCSRAQIITFLWRAVGSPEPKTATTVSDVRPDDYYYKAVLWAAENDMFSGDAFLPSAPCTRAMAVEFIWKQAGQPSASGCRFIDVPSSASYVQAVAWAINNGVTYGTSNTTFSPDATCTRGQIVTFLYRTFAK